MKPIIYAPSGTMAYDYLRANDLSPHEFKLVTRQDDLIQAVRGTMGLQILIVNDHPIDLHTLTGLKTRKPLIERVSY